MRKCEVRSDGGSRFVSFYCKNSNMVNRMKFFDFGKSRVANKKFSKKLKILDLKKKFEKS